MEINLLTLKEHFFKANEHYKNREYFDAEREYKNAIEKYPSFSEAHYNLANLLLKLKRKEEAKDEYRRALEIDSDFVEANYNLGILLFIEREYKESQNLFIKAIKIKPDDVLIRKYLEIVSSIVGKEAPLPTTVVPRRRLPALVKWVIFLSLLFLIFIPIGIHIHNLPTKFSPSLTTETTTTSKPIELDSNKTKILVAYFNELSVLSDRYNKIYSENNSAAGECIKAGDDDGFINYMNNIISSEKDYYNQLESLNIPPEAQDLHRINLERLQTFIDYLPYQINFHFDKSTKDIRDSKYEIYKQKKIELYNEYERIKNELGIETDFETVFTLKKPQ